MTELFRNYIAGEWKECLLKKTFPNTNPARNDEIVGSFQPPPPRMRNRFATPLMRRSRVGPLCRLRAGANICSRLPN